MSKEFLALPIKTLFLVCSLLLLQLLSIQSSYAKFLMEPQYYHYSSSFESDTNSGSLVGDTLGINIGYLGKYFMAGFKAEKGEYTFGKAPMSDGFTSYSGGGLGTFIGFHFLDRWKVVTGYLNTSFEPKSNDDIRYFGQQASLLIGYRVFSGFFINVMAFRNQFTQLEDDTTGKTQSLESNIKTQGNSLSLSYMFVL